MKKYVVYMTNQFCLLGREYMKLEGKFVVGLHNPNLADHFSTMKAAKALQSKIKYDTKVCELQPELDLFAKTNWVYRKIAIMNEDLNVKYDSNTMDKMHVLNWWNKIKRAPESAVSQAVYSSYPNLYSLFKHLCDAQSYYSKDYKNLYHSYHILTPKDGSFKEFKKELSLVLENVTYLTDDGYKVFPIFDNSLSEHGTRYLYYKSEDDCKLKVSHYTEPKSTSLEECFKEMCRSYYYTR